MDKLLEMLEKSAEKSKETQMNKLLEMLEKSTDKIKSADKSKLPKKLIYQPTFYTVTKFPIRAGGVIFYTIKNNKLKLLLQQINDVFEDIGGRTDALDSNIIDTITREVGEETNYIISKEKCHFLIHQNEDANYTTYIKQGKYMLYIVRVGRSIYNIPLNRYGKKEIHDNKTRTFHWVNSCNFDKIKLHERLEFAREKLSIIFGSEKINKVNLN